MVPIFRIKGLDRKSSWSEMSGPFQIAKTPMLAFRFSDWKHRLCKVKENAQIGQADYTLKFIRGGKLCRWINRQVNCYKKLAIQ